MTKTETAAQLDLDKLRAEFEAAAPGNLVDITRSKPFPDRYKFEHSEFMWRFWQQAAQAAVAQARAQPAAAPIALSVNSGEGGPSIDTWTPDEQAAFSAWAITKFPNESSQGLISLGEAWKQGQKFAHRAQAGWKLVPIEPTDAMACAAIGVSLSDRESLNGVAQYRAMLAAAPAAPHAQAEPVAWLEAEPSARGQDPKSVAWSILYSSRIHTKCAPMTSNPVWPLYAAPAPQEAEQASASPAGVKP